MSLFNDDPSSIRESDNEDMFGFSKTFITLTAPGKVVALSSLDGSIQWTYFDPAEKAVNVLVEKTGENVDVIVVSGNALTYLDPVTGSIREQIHHDKIGAENDFMLV